jgi:hypothetical protein
MIMNYNLLYHFFLELKRRLSLKDNLFLLFITLEFKIQCTIFHLSKELLCIFYFQAI